MLSHRLTVLLALLLGACASDGGSPPPPGPLQAGPPVITIERADMSLTALLTAERGSSDSFSVRLGGEAQGEVRVRLDGHDSTEVSVEPSELIFGVGAWGVVQTVTVTGLDDEDIDGTQVFSLNVDASQSEDAGFSALPIQWVNIVNVDDEVPGITLIGGVTAFSEAGGSGNFSIVLNAAPDGDVAVTVGCTDESEALLSDGVDAPAAALSLLFTPQDWQDPRQVLLVGQDDTELDGDRKFDLSVGIDPAATTDGVGYLAVQPVSMPITVLDDETDGVQVTVQRNCALP